MMRYLSVLFICFALSTFLGCDAPKATANAADQKPKNKSALVQVITAQKQTLSKELDLTGDVVATRTVVIRNSVEGPVAFCPWREGDSVTKGELLVKIDRPMYQAEMLASRAAVEVARARLADLTAGVRKEEQVKAAQKVRQLKSLAKFAKKDRDRVARLVETGALPEEALEKASLAYIKADADLISARETYQILKSGPTRNDIDVQTALVKETEARLAIARAKLEECTINAPFDGIITRVEAMPGDLASARSALLTMMDTSSIVVRFNVPESESAMLNRKTPILISYDALGSKPYPAQILRVYPQIDPKTRTRTVESVPESAHNLVPGMFARVRLTTQKAVDTIVVPEKVVLTMENGSSAAFVVKDLVSEKRSIKLGIENGSCIQVLEGIRAGEQVIISGQEKLKPGTRVKLSVLKSNAPCSNAKGKTS